MPSRAYSSRLEGVLRDAEDILNAHETLRTGQRGRQRGLGGLNRAVVVLSVAAWEAYIEEVVLEAISAARPSSGPMGTWTAWSSTSTRLVGRLHTPNPEKVRELLRDTLGITDIAASWHWHSCDATTARSKLRYALKRRHEIAHGADPRPVIHNTYARWLPGFFERLGRCTDKALRAHLVSKFGVSSPW